MGKSTFNWWRRHPKRKVLSNKRPLIERINNGDFEVSQYFEEAEAEKRTLLELKKKEEDRGKKLGLKYESIRQNIFNATDEYQRRYNRLMKDAYRDEDRILNEIEKSFRKQFGDIPQTIFDEWLNGREDDMTVEDLYYRCREIQTTTKPNR